MSTWNLEEIKSVPSNSVATAGVDGNLGKTKCFVCGGGGGGGGSARLHT